MKWRVITRDNITTLFGWTAESRITAPDDVSRIFEWLPEFVFDDKGNCAHYIYKKEDAKGLDDSFLHNRNRIKNGKITYTNVYISKIVYGNKTPYKQFGDAYPAEDDYLFSTVFDYGEYNRKSPFNIISDWDFRPDAFSDYKTGFEIRTTRLCKRVLLFHHFKGTGEYNGLVKSQDFSYDTNSEEGFTFLKSITSSGYIKNQNNVYSKKSLPPMEFSYENHNWNKEVKTIASDNLVNAPSGFAGPNYQFIDLFNEGLPGILTEEAEGWYYKHNAAGGVFDQATQISPKPSFSGLGTVMQLVDLDANGQKQFVSFNEDHPGYFELDDQNLWQNFTPFKNLPNVDFSDANTRMLDLNGDGKPEAVITEDTVFTWYASDGKNGFTQARKTTKGHKEEEGPNIVFADSTQNGFFI